LMRSKLAQEIEFTSDFTRDERNSQGDRDLQFELRINMHK